MDPNEHYKRLNEAYKEFEKQHREHLKRMKVIRAFGVGLMVYVVTMLLLVLGTVFINDRLTIVLDLVGFLGNAGVLLFMVWSYDGKHTPRKLKLLLFGCMGLNGYLVIEFLLKYT